MNDNYGKGAEQKIRIIYHPDYLIHTQAAHPERKERLEYVLHSLEEKKLMGRVEIIEPESANFDDIALIHEPSYIKSIEQACLEGRSFIDMDTYIVPDSYRVALLSAGGALHGLKLSVEQEEAVFVLNRPPGHHAERNRAMGFCLFNNIAIAAEAARQKYGFQKVAIVDWDVHHGNGTQHSFEDDPNVLFISIHQSPFYPGTGSAEETGSGRGEGFTVNIPLPPGCGDSDYDLFFDKLIVPVLAQYKPEMIFVSAGQDAYRQDPLAGMHLTLNGYYSMADKLVASAQELAGGRIVFCLEGGYHLQGQAEAIIQVLNAAAGWGLPVTEKEPALNPPAQVLRRFDEIYAVQSKYWDLQ